MRCSIALTTALFAMLLTASPRTFAQELRVIRVGVPVMKNNAGRSVPGNLERDRLVKALNGEKPDKKLHMKVQGVALDGTNPEEAVSQGAEKKCDYIVYTTLIELRTQGDRVQRRPGTIEINPKRTESPETAAMNPEYRATVEYKLYRTGDQSAISGAPFSTQEAMPEIEVVSQVMDRIANRVFDEVKKGVPPRP
ncbi:MAG TPA: hypothetical protein VFN26_12495 [Candidatus Acidoferrum sp.]|nr:hypothetical protein [Candidatus Acidoferrum sp.]